MERKIKVVCPNCGHELDKIDENWSGDNVEIYETYALDKNGQPQVVKTEIAEANINPDTFVYLCPYCDKEIVLEKPSDVMGTYNYDTSTSKTDVEIIADFLSGKTKGKPEGGKK